MGCKMRVLFGMKKEDSTYILGSPTSTADPYTDSATYTLAESRFNFSHLRFRVGYGNDGYTVFELPVTNSKYFTLTLPTGAGNDCYKIFVFCEWTSDYSFTGRTGKDLWLAAQGGTSMTNTTIASRLTNAPNNYECRPVKSIAGLNRKVYDGIHLDLNSWTIVNTDTITIKGGRVVHLGLGGWKENAYKSFTVPESGTYRVSYDYKILNARCGNHGTYGFGLWFTQNSPNVTGDPQYNFYANSSNRTGTVILARSESASNKSGHVSYDVTCNAGTTYYLWYPGGALDDGTTFNLDFINIKVQKV